MFIRSLSDAPQKTLPGLASHILLKQGDVGNVRLAVTWVEVQPGAMQKPHAHAQEQVYVVVAGRGVMHVGVDRQAVAEGDLVHIPPHAEHYVENTGDELLSYISAATPAFSADDIAAFYDQDASAER